MRRINRGVDVMGSILMPLGGRRYMFTSYYSLSSGIGFWTVWGDMAGVVWAEGCLWLSLKPAIGGIRVTERL